MRIREHWILNQATRRLVGVKIGDGFAVWSKDDTLLDFFEEGSEQVHPATARVLVFSCLVSLP